MNNIKTGQFILSRRKELGFTQNQLAERLNVTDKAISKWENGKCAPDIATLVPLAEVLEVSVVVVLFLFSLVPAYHYFSTVSGEMDTLIEDAYASAGDDFQNYEENCILKNVEKGDYIALLMESSRSISCAVYRRDEIFIEASGYFSHASNLELLE